jgi:hypothetical protein
MVFCVVGCTSVKFCGRSHILETVNISRNIPQQQRCELIWRHYSVHTSTSLVGHSVKNALLYERRVLWKHCIRYVCYGNTVLDTCVMETLH